MRKPPNIIIINPDQMRWDYCSHAGHPFIETTNISRLSDMGTWFQNAFVSCAMCGPSRISFVTGQYPIEHGARDFGPGLEPDTPNALLNLGAAGYVRALYGKDHMMLSRLEAPSPIGVFYDEGEDICLGAMLDHPDHLHSYSSGTLEANSKWDITKRLTDSGIDFILRSKRVQEPFFLTINYQDPHPYFACPEPYASMFSPGQFELPANFRSAPASGEPTRLSLWREHSRHMDATRDEMLKLMAIYCGQIRYVDDQVGRILDVLESEGMIEDTIIVFWSDHGEYLNDFGVTHKQAAFYESLIRAPLVLWDPTNTIPRGRFRGLVEAMDIMATVLDLAGVPQPEGSRAWSLARPDYVPRSDVFADGGLYRRPPQEVIPGLRLRSAGPPSAYGPGAMLRTERYKLCVSACDRTELYDLENDPHESVNLADDSSYTRIKAEMYGRLMDRILCKGQAPKHMPTWGSEVKNN